MSDATPQMTETTHMSDAEAEVWDELWDTDAARCCSCPSCNFYAPDYEQHKGEPCILRTLIEQIVRHREIAATANTLAVAAVSLRRVADYWDGRPLAGHGAHIYGDLMDVLRAIDADEKYNRDRIHLEVEGGAPTSPMPERQSPIPDARLSGGQIHCWCRAGSPDLPVSSPHFKNVRCSPGQPTTTPAAVARATESAAVGGAGLEESA